MDISQSSERSHLKQNVLASKLEGLMLWVASNRQKVLAGLGIILAAILIASVLFLRNKEQNELAWTRLAQSQAYIGQKRFEEAKQILTDVKTQMPNSVAALNSSFYLGEVTRNLKQYDESIGHYSDVISKAGKNPIKPLALVALGSVYEEKGDFPKAEQTYQQFLDQYSDHFLAARTLLLIGRAQLMAGNKEKARKSFGQLIDLYPKSKWAEMARQFMDKT